MLWSVVTSAGVNTRYIGVGGTWEITQGPGTVHLVLDNTYSRLRSKGVKFHIAVRNSESATALP
eukprot:m.68383 g.68383  ORF g.68383 m.68383 type:complete len:64 (+) comp15984_c0_seq12:2219-2410(+)